MRIKPFQLERFFARHEFRVRHILSASDCESLSLRALLDLAGSEETALWNDLELGYTESQGAPLLREEIARLYQTINPSDVLVAAPEEAIFLVMNCLLQAGDHIIVTFPAYQSLFQIAQALGCQVTRWALRPEQDTWTLDLDFLQASITDHTKLIVINFPHNPTGYLPTRDQMSQIIEIAQSHDLPLFSDEMYWRLEHRPETQLPAVCDRYERGISLFGLSKTFALPGLRIGWLASHDQEMLKKLIHLKDYTTICSSAPSEILGLIALRARKAIIQRSQEIIQGNLQVAKRFFSRYRGLLDWLEPGGGSITFPRLAAGIPTDQFCQDLLEEKNILIAPGTLFEFPGHFRLGLGRSDFAEAIELLDAFIIEKGL